MKEIQGSKRSTQASVLPATEALPDAFLGEEEALRDEDGSPDWLGNRLMPQDISFVEMVLLDRLLRRAFYTVRLEGPVDGKRLAQAYAAKLYRTEVYRRKGCKTRVTRLLLCLGEGVFAYLSGGSLTVYGPTPQTAHGAASEFLRFVRPKSRASALSRQKGKEYPTLVRPPELGANRTAVLTCW